jgi:hypothetical protein
VTGYLIVLSMLGVALVGALIAFTVDARREEREENIKSEITAIPEVIRWLNLSAEGSVDSGSNWTSLIRDSLSIDTVDLVNLSSESAKASDLYRRFNGYSGDKQFDIVTVWAGAEDLLAGIDLLVFEQSLAAILQSVNGPGTLIVVANIPDLTPELVAAQLAKHDAVKAVIEQWNGSIARLTAANNATLADLHQPMSDGPPPVHWLSGTTFLPDEAAQREVARQFAVAMTSAVEHRMSDHLALDNEESAPT